MTAKVNSNDDPSSNEFTNTASAPWLTKHIASLLAITTVTLSFVLFFILIYNHLESEKKDIAIYILGVLSAIDSQIFSFYFGSSKESEAKNRMIQHHMTKK